MDLSKVPVHVSFIMDGNGRWAKARGKERFFGHMAGVESVRACADAAIEAGVKVVSFYAFSEENWNRPQAEVNALMELFSKYLDNEYDNLMRDGIKLLIIGNRSRLSGSLLKSIDRMQDATAGNSNLTMVVFISYSGQWDIVQAARKLALEALDADDKDAMRSRLESLDNRTFSDYLATAGIPDPDLIVRTSGEERLSNYLLWQGAYSELVFTDTLWPDFRKEAFMAALQEYASRDRRYGKVK